MKKYVLLLILMLTLCGCSQRDFETVGDVFAPETLQAPGKMELALPDQATIFTSSGAENKLYFCDGYEIMLETCKSGDIDSTLRSLTGFGKDGLVLMETSRDSMKCTECAWTAADEEGELVARTVVLDDGVYHYCLTLTAGASESGALQKTWQEIAASFHIKA